MTEQVSDFMEKTFALRRNKSILLGCSYEYMTQVSFMCGWYHFVRLQENTSCQILRDLEMPPCLTFLIVSDYVQFIRLIGCPEITQSAFTKVKNFCKS